MGVTFTVSRQSMEHMLSFLGLSEATIQNILSQINKQHRHINAVSFADLLEKNGLKANQVKNLFRRIGMDDITITNVFNALDEERINKEYGKLVEIKI